MFKWCSVVTKGPKVSQENIPHTITSSSLDWWYKAGWLHFYGVYSRFWASNLNVAAEIETLQTGSCCSNFPIVQFPVLGWPDWCQLWFAAEVHLLQGLICCVVRVRNYCCLCISSKQSVASAINKTISPKGTSAHWVCFLYRTILWDVCGENPSTSGVSELLKAVCLTPQPCHEQTHMKVTILPLFVVGLNFCRSSWPYQHP